MRTFLLSLLLLTVSLCQAHAQNRLAPPPATPQTFVAQVEQGAAGDFLWVSLRGRNQHGQVRAAEDLLIYDRSSGGAWLVRNFGPVYGVLAPTTVVPLLESGCGLTLRPGLHTLIASDIDGDGRDDLVGYDRTTGAVVRYYQRGLNDGCQP
jgi:hypothetical protein